MKQTIMWLTLTLVLGLAGCDINDDDEDQGDSMRETSPDEMMDQENPDEDEDMEQPDPAPAPQMYEFSLRNATNAQPLSPVAIGLHRPGYSAWEIGAPASSGLEALAEAGLTADFLAEFGDHSLATTSADGPLAPGAQASWMLQADEGEAVAVSLATMLVNTNDAFSGTSNLSLAHLAPGQVYTLSLPIYDAGTEGNSEMAGTIPGPADGGEGYNEARDDVGFVAMHPGVVTADDGLSASTLDESHRFASGSIQLTITRVQ